MTRRAVAIACALLASSCGDGRDGPPPETVVRVAAVSGLPQFEPGAERSGASAAAIDLVYDSLATYTEVLEQTSDRLVLKRRPESTQSVDELARSFRFAGANALVARDDRIEIRVTDESLTSRVVVEQAGFDVGPFRLVSYSPERVVLRRRGDSDIDVIEIVATSASDQWRRLLARDIDIVPMSPATVRQQLAGIDGVRVIEGPRTQAAVLYFNTATVDPEQRRRIASILDLEALGQTVCGATCTLDSRAGADSDAEIDRELTLAVVDSVSSHALAARVVHHQLGRAGIRLRVEAGTVQDMMSTVRDGSFDLVMGPLPTSARRYQFFVSPKDRGTPVATPTAYSNPEYDAAFEAGDQATMDRLLARDVPVLPLFDEAQVAVIDARWCGDVTQSVSSWRWIAELRPCAAGEAP